MIVSAVATIGIQCSKCGELQFRTLSVFAFSHFNQESYSCTCGAHLIIITSIERSNFSIEYPCIYCGESHYLLTKRNHIWGEDLLKLVCNDKNLPIGYIGHNHQVVNSCQEIKKNFVQLASQLVNDGENEYEFDNFFIVYAIMEKISKMVERGQIGCRCGNKNLTVEILSDKIELVCQACYAIGTIYTDNKEILRIIDSMGSIFLEDNMTWFPKDPLEGHNLVKNK